MALTIANTHPQKPAVWLGNVAGRMVTLTFDNSYPTGGESLSAADLGMSEIFQVHLSPDSSTTAEGFVFQYDYTAETVQVYDEGAVADAPLTELANASPDVDGAEVRAFVIGVF